MSEFGRLIHRLRTARCLSQSALAERADFEHSTIARWEQGARHPSRQTVGQVVASLDLDDELATQLYVAAGYLPPGWEALSSDPQLIARITAVARALSITARNGRRSLIRDLATRAA